MSAITENGALEVGILVGAGIHHGIVMRQARMEDAYRSLAQIEPPDHKLATDAERVAYAVRLEDMQLLGQIEQLGSLAGADIPAPDVLLSLIDPDDMNILRGMGDRLKKKLKESRSASPPSAKPSASSPAPASASM